MSLPSALQVAEILFQHVFFCYGILEEIVYNHGPQFASKGWCVFFRCLGVAISLTSRLATWFGQSTGLTPFECALGCQPPLCPWDSTPIDVPAVDEWFHRAERIWEGAQTVLRYAVQHFTEQANYHWRNAPEYKVGDRVWLSTWDLWLHLPSRKLSQVK